VEGLLQQLQQRVACGTGKGSTAAGSPAPPPQTERYTRPSKEDKPERKERSSKRTLKPADPGVGLGIGGRAHAAGQQAA